ncbi:MAG: hypothetical protein WC479_09730 [Candidatus Izemoplasmatales bacterium]
MLLIRCDYCGRTEEEKKATINMRMTYVGAFHLCTGCFVLVNGKAEKLRKKHLEEIKELKETV